MDITGEEKHSIMQNFRPPWDEKPRKAFAGLVESGRLKPGRLLELGCGAARNAIYLATHGFEVTGVESDPELVALARKRAMAARVPAKFEVDDLTNLQNVTGPFDVLVDYSTLDDLDPEARDRERGAPPPLSRGPICGDSVGG